MNQSSLNSSSETPRVRVLLSTDTILECFTNFNGRADEVENLIELARLKKIKAYVTDYCLQKIGFYLGKPDLDLGQQAVSQVRTLLEDRLICISRDLMEDARRLPIRDFDIAIEVACAMKYKLDAIVTQDPQRFEDQTLPAIKIEDFLLRQSLEESLQHSLPITFVMGSWQYLKEVDELLFGDRRFQVNLFGTNSRNNLTIWNLQYANLQKANLSSVILRGVDLRGANLQEAKLIFASLYCARLNGANLSYTDMRSVNLSLATLSDSDLSFADLSSSNLSASDLSNALLYEANLQGSNLQDANLQNANLQGADLQGANLKGTRFQDAEVNLSKFGQNIGLTEAMKVELIHKGAIFLEDKQGKRCISL